MFNEANQLIQYEPVWLILHNVHDKDASFIQIRTESGRVLELSPKHLLPVRKCKETAVDAHYRFADRVKVGDCLIQVNSGLELDRVASIETVTLTGYYSPLTSTGTIIVNGLVSSCYSSFENQKLLHVLFGIIRGFLEVWDGMSVWMQSFCGADVAASAKLPIRFQSLFLSSCAKGWRR